MVCSIGQFAASAPERSRDVPEALGPFRARVPRKRPVHHLPVPRAHAAGPDPVFGREKRVILVAVLRDLVGPITALDDPHRGAGRPKRTAGHGSPSRVDCLTLYYEAKSPETNLEAFLFEKTGCLLER